MVGLVLENGDIRIAHEVHPEVAPAEEWLQVVEHRRRLGPGQVHVGPSYRLIKGTYRRIEALWEAVDGPPPSEAAMLREKVEQAKSMEDLRAALVEVLDFLDSRLI